MPNPYRILRLQPDASSEQIEDAYHRMRRLVSYGSAGDGVTEQSVNTAYAVLSDPQRRARIDSAIRSRRRPGRAVDAMKAVTAPDRSPAAGGSGRSGLGLYARLRRILPFL